MAQTLRIGQCLKRIRRPVTIEDDVEYQLVTVRLKHGGVIERCRKIGKDIGTKKMYRVNSGDFILSGIDARNGAFGIVPDELDGAVVTNDFWYFDVNEEAISTDLFLALTQTNWFDHICRLGSDGTTQRIRLQKDKFFNQMITLPPVEKQPSILKILLNFKGTGAVLTTEIEKQKKLLAKYRQAILQEAIEGKLTTDLPCRQAGWRKKTFRNISDKWVPEQSASYFTYVLECEDGSLYKGFSQDLFSRINRHLEGSGAKWTKEHPPVALIYFEEFNSEAEAVEREKYFKSGSGREWINEIKNEQKKKHEPAAELLERIAKEKEQLIKERKIRPARRGGKQKPLPEIKPDEIPFDIPESWRWCRLVTICQKMSTGPFGSMLHKSDYVKHGTPLVNPTNLIDHLIVENEKMLINDSTKKRLLRYELAKDDMVIARRGDLSKSAIVSEREAGWLCGTGSFFITFHEEILPRFVLLLYTSQYSQGILNFNAIGATMSNLNQKLLSNLPIPLPPLSEQQEIVRRVEARFALCDQLEAQITASAQTAETLSAAILQELFDQNGGEA